MKYLSKYKFTNSEFLLRNWRVPLQICHDTVQSVNLYYIYSLFIKNVDSSDNTASNNMISE